MLAMDFRAPRGARLHALSFTTIASMLAPTTPQANKLALPSLCRSEHARDGLQGAAGCQASRFIVYDHREHARSYHTPGRQTGTTITL